MRKSNLILKEFENQLHIQDEDENEINQIIHKDKEISFCDDLGYIYKIQKNEILSEKRHDSICTSIVYQNNDILSCGLDYQLIYKNQKIKFNSLQQKSFNPPQAHRLSINPSLNRVACGLGNSKIAIIDLKSFQIIHYLEKHLYIVNQLWILIF